MSVKRLLRTHDSVELAELEAADRLDPIDWARRIELSNAIVASTIANCHRGTDQEPYQSKDFMMDWGAEYRDATEEANKRREHTANAIEDTVKSLGLTWG